MDIDGSNNTMIRWQSLIGERVEVWRKGELYRTGVVDNAMPNGSGLWLARDGASHREFIDRARGYHVQIASD
jgi:hypothetical protein